MNRISIRKEKLTHYKTVIFDLDGTLYYQNPFRVRMACWLFGYVISHPSAVKDMLIIKKYREVRERWEIKGFGNGMGDSEGNLDLLQYGYVAEKMKVPPERVRKTIEFFMLDVPLRLLGGYRDGVLADMIQKLRRHGVTIAVYSDYPVEGKLRALGIEADACYTSADDRIGCMKPDPKGIRVILDDQGISNTEAVMIGDRYEKDGLAAIGNDVDYIIVGKKKKERGKLRDLVN